MATTHECPYCGEELRAQQSTDGTKLELQQRIVFLEAQLMEAVMSRPQCSDEAFSAYVKGAVEDAVAEAVAKERGVWTAAWYRREEEWQQMGGEKSVTKGITENDPGYQSFLKMSQKGRARRQCADRHITIGTK